MYVKNWKWFVVALCCTTLAACRHPRGEQCSTTCSKPAAGCASKDCQAAPPVVAVKPCPCGTPRTFVFASPTCNMCKTAPKAPCNTCLNPATVPAALPATTATPRPLDPNITAAKPLDPKTLAVPDANAAFRDHRDPATGHVRYDHARDFSWVVGELQYLHTKKQWRVRYAPIDVDDTHGGSVTLSGVDHLTDQLKSGMTVRLQGQLIEPDLNKSAPDYHVYGIKTLE